MNKTNLIYIVSIVMSIFIGSVGFCSSPWATHIQLSGSFAAIPITVTLLGGAKTINHTGVTVYSDSGCSTDTGSGFNIGANDNKKFIFTTSTIYYLGLSATEYTSIMHGANAGSIKVTVDADGGTSGFVCIPMSCSSSTSCALTSAGPFSLSI